MQFTLKNFIDLQNQNAYLVKKLAQYEKKEGTCSQCFEYRTMDNNYTCEECNTKQLTYIK